MLEPLTVLDSLKPSHDERFDVIIIGSGPAGMSAAVCCARADLKTLIIERALPGGGVSSSFKVHNVLGFPGIFRGALDCRATEITEKMKVAAAEALASVITNPTEDEILPYSTNKEVVLKVSEAVKGAWGS